MVEETKNNDEENKEQETIRAKVRRKDFEKINEKWPSFREGIEQITKRYVDENEEISKIREEQKVDITELEDETKVKIKNANGITAEEIIESHFKDKNRIYKKNIEKVLAEIYTKSTARKHISQMRDIYETRKPKSLIGEEAQNYESFEDAKKRFIKRASEEYFEAEIFFRGEDKEKIKEEVENEEKRIMKLAKR